MMCPKPGTRPSSARNSRLWAGKRVQYSLYLFEGEDHEIDRVIRYMRRVAAQVPQGDIRLIPMERSVWEQQVVLLGESETPQPRPFPNFILFW